MDIHEYQAKELLAEFGVPVPRGGLAYSPEQAAYRRHELGGEKVVVKAQIHSGARGKAGGIVLCETDTEVAEAAERLLGRNLVTQQTGPRGRIVQRLYIEAAQDIAREFYVGLVLDRASERVMVVASAEGGMEIEDISARKPDSLIKVAIEPAVGMREFQAREIAFGLGLPAAVVPQAVNTLMGVYRAFRDLDATMVEINPLVLTGDNRVLALDCKMSFDDNALFRRSRISELRDKSQEDPREMQAADRGLSYVGLDMIKLAGGEPANFMDIGGGASPERVAKAMRLVLADGAAKVILVNIFAGINRCDWVAQGVVQAVQKLDLEVPLVVRLSGTLVEEGRKILADSGLDLTIASTLKEAAEAAVKAVPADTESSRTKQGAAA